MKKLTEQSPLSTAAVIGFIVLIPFIALELINRWKFNEGFPWAVFIFTYILQTVFIFLLLPIVKRFKPGNP